MYNFPNTIKYFINICLMKTMSCQLKFNYSNYNTIIEITPLLSYINHVAVMNNYKYFMI